MNPTDGFALIELNQVAFAYPGTSDKTALNLPLWRVSKGEHVLLIGDSGSGKSTLLGLLSGMLTPDSGNVLVDGHALEKMTGRELDRFRASHIGYVAQSFNLIAYLSAIDNIKLSSYFARDSKHSHTSFEVEALLLELNISSEQALKPVHQLSVGQQQRVAIARAIANMPEVIIADEPTSALDQANRDQFMSVLMTVANAHNITIVLVSHDLSLTHYFDRVDSMNDINQAEAQSYAD